MCLPVTPAQVRYGAERVFASEASNITEEDVDALIAKVCVDPEGCELLARGTWCSGAGALSSA